MYKSIKHWMYLPAQFRLFDLTYRLLMTALQLCLLLAAHLTLHVSDALLDYAQALLAAASVLDDRCDAGHLGRATEIEGEELHGALDELEWNRWLVAEQRGYVFVARIVRDVIARDMLTPGQRARLQERSAGA